MTEISIAVPDWFLWAATGWMLIHAALTGVEIWMKREVYKRRERYAHKG